jgi:hypothetical protein
MLEKGGFPGTRRGDNQTSLPLADRGHQIHDTCRETLRNCLQPDALVGADGGEFLEERDVHVEFRVAAFDFRAAEQLDPAGPAPCLTLDKNTVAKVELSDHLGRDEDVILRGRIGTLGLPKESKALPGDLDNPLGKSRFRRRSILRDGRIGASGIEIVRSLIPPLGLGITTPLIVGLTVSVVPAISEGSASAGITTSTAAGIFTLSFPSCYGMTTSGIPRTLRGW